MLRRRAQATGLHTAAALSATPLAPLGEQLPAMQEPWLPPPPPADQRARAAFGEMGVAPPPVIAQPIAEWDWEGPSSGESPVLIGESPLRDTLPDLPAGLEMSSDSETSISLIVEPRAASGFGRMPLWLLMALVLTPVVLAGLVLLVLWLRDAPISGPL